MDLFTVVRAFSKLVELNSAEAAEKSLFASEGQKVSLQISGVKLAMDTENQVIKIKLPHSPLSPNKDVCLFVKDLEKGLMRTLKTLHQPAGRQRCDR